MSLFQNTVVSKHLQSQNKENLLNQWKGFKTYFHNSEIQDNIRNSKEEQFQEGFLRELFVKILHSVAHRGVLEWVSKEDPMVQFLLRNRHDVFDTYTWDNFETIVGKYFKIEKTLKVNNGCRTLCWLEPLE